MMELKGKRALVVGLAKSGQAAARCLVRQGAKVRVTDSKTEAELKKSWPAFSDLPVESFLGGHPREIFLWAELIVVSPGVPRFLPALLAAEQAGIEIVSELEFASRLVTAPILAVGGTNGKTTTTTLLGEMVKAELGPDQVFVGGNIGTPLTELVLSGQAKKALVLEVSSFQMEFAPTFHPRVGIMLNVTDDHLDRYRDFSDYAETKRRMFARCAPDDFAVLNADDPVCAAMARGTRAAAIWFGLEDPPRPGLRLSDRTLTWTGPEGSRQELSLKRFKPVGVHNLQNAMAATAAALCFGISAETIQRTLDRFQGLPHRLEWISEKDGVSYYNDSKATNVGAVVMAVRSFQQPIILLLGGQAKGCHFQALRPELKDRVKLVITFGESREQLAEELVRPEAYPIQVVETLAEAYAAARRVAVPGDVVLLSPACASFDQFRNYQDRGDSFRRLASNPEPVKGSCSASIEGEGRP
jgi:UDP-N-acetylmuramoylalanine--D-glutamate ligase